MLILVCLTIAVCYVALHGYTFDPDENFHLYDHIINNEFWKNSEGKLPTFVVSDPVKKSFAFLIAT